MGSPCIRYQLRSKVARITLAAPEAGNALDGRLAREITGAVLRAGAEPDCRAIVLSAIGPDFCRGMNFDALLENGCDVNHMMRDFADCLAAIGSSLKPVIACVEGNAMGGGVGLTAACDLVLASKESTFSLPEVMVGMIPALIAPFLLRRMSLARVRYLALSSRPIGAEEAREYGLVDQVAAEGMQTALRAQLQRLFCSSPAALSQVKQYFDRLDGSDFDRQRQAAADELDQWLGQRNVMEGVRTFAQGFSPQWFEKYRECNDGQEDSH